MKIAILGWGSLIWDPRSLQIISSEDNKKWLDDGVKLPIEFARISGDGRLTLVIKDNAVEITTLFSISVFQNLDEAILDLAVREGCGKNKIGFYNRQTKKINPTDFKYIKNIQSWLDIHSDIDAVIWTNLSPNFKDKIGLPIDAANALNYLKHIPLEIQVKAEEYIRKTPAIVDTIIRTAIEEELGWNKIIQPN
jgi:hypothetical protein